MKLPDLLRLVLLISLVGLILRPPRVRPAPAVELPLPTGAALPDSLLTGPPPRRWVRQHTAPPSAAELDVLAALAQRAPLWAALPAGGRRIRADLPAKLWARRTAGLVWELCGGFHVPTRVLLLDRAAEPVDSALARPRSDGCAEGVFPVRPLQPGWNRWTVAAGPVRANTGAWVRAATPLRVLIAAGPPSWESRFLVRALEESGVRVDLVQPLAPGLPVDSAAPALPTTASALARYDALLLLAGAEPGSGFNRAAREYVDAGGGLLTGGASPVGAGFGLGIPESDGRESRVRAAEIRWAPPAELVALPPSPMVAVGAVRLRTPLPGAYTAAWGPEGAILALRSFGRGRVAGLSLLESWPWRMEAGETEAHRRFWLGLVEWLASGERTPERVTVARSFSGVGLPQAVTLTNWTGRQVGERDLRLLGPGGESESLVLAAVPGRPGTFQTRWVPVRAGLYRLRSEGDTVGAAVQARPPPTGESESAAWAHLAMLVSHSNGIAAPPDELAAALASTRSKVPADRHLDARLSFAALVGLAATEWALRRLRREA